MKRQEQLTKQLGGNILASMGAGAKTEGTGALKSGAPAAPPVISMAQREGRTVDRNSHYLRLDRITVENQVRKDFDEDHIKNLAKSIEKVGLKQPILVRWSEDKELYIVVAGECRYRAVKSLGHDSIRVVTDESDYTEEELMVVQLMENCVRKDLNPIERAQSFKHLQTKEGWTVQQVADAVCVNKSTVSRCLSLLTLPEDVQQKIRTGEIPANTAQQLTKVKDEKQQREFIEQIETGGLSRDEAREAVEKTIPGKSKPKKRGKPVTTKTIKLDSGVSVAVKARKKRVTKEDWIAYLEEALELMRAA